MISIYDPQTLELQCNIARATSIIWNLSFYDAGSFEIHLSPDSPFLDQLQLYRLIKHKNHCGIILYRRQNKDDIEIRGCDLNGLTTFRQVVPPFVYLSNPTTISSYDRASGNAETVMRHYIVAHMTNPTETARRIDNLSLGANGQRGQDIVWQARFTNLADELKKIGQYAQVGYNISFHPDSKQLIFDCLMGTDRTDSVTFCREYRNITDFDYTNDATGAVNLAYVGGSGEEEQQYIEKVYKESNAPTGIRRQEGFTSSNGTVLSDVKDAGLSYIDENKAVETVESESNTKLMYGRDWFLGDYVTVKIKAFGETMILEKQITEVQEVYERANNTVKPIFGDVKNSTIKRILRGVKQ